MAYRPYIAYFNPAGADALGRWSRHLVLAMNDDKATVDAYAVHAERLAEAQATYGAGAIVVPASRVTVPWWAEPGACWYRTSDGTIAESKDLFPVRTAFRTFHNRGDYLAELLAEFGPIEYPQWALTLAHDSLHAWHIFGYVLWHWDAVPAADKVRTLQMASLGPNDQNAAMEQRYDREHPETIFPIMTDMWENNADQRTTIRNIGARALAMVEITIEDDDSVTLARRSLLEMYTDSTSALTARDVPTLTELDGCSYIDGIDI